VEIRDGGVVEAESLGTGRSGAITLEDVGRLEMTNGGRISARASSVSDAGPVSLGAAAIHMVDSEVTTEAAAGGGGQIDVRASDRVELVRSRLTTSVIESGSAGDGGDITIASPRFVVLNQSQILAQAERGNGGNIRITTDVYIESIDSRVDASSVLGVDGLVVIEAPEVNTAVERAALRNEIVDPGLLIREPCAARRTGEGGSFEVLGPEGVPRPPDAPLPSPYLPDPSGAAGTPPAAGVEPGPPLMVVRCGALVAPDVAGP
jgi:hypothetical protein